jgi:hypothetical protein
MEQSGKPLTASKTPRRPYAKPDLLEYGSVAELTAVSGAASKQDNPSNPPDMGSV